MTIEQALAEIQHKCLDDTIARPDEPTFLAVWYTPGVDKFQAHIMWDHHDGAIPENDGEAATTLAGAILNLGVYIKERRDGKSF